MPLIIVWFAIFSIILLFIYPLDSADVFLYSLQGRMISLYNFNPYEIVPSQISADLMYSYIPLEWANQLMVYGPLWAMIAAAMAWLVSGLGLISNLLIFKALAILVNAGCVFLVYKILKIIKPEYATWGAWLYAWNPFVLWQTAIDAHNDIVMIFLVLLAFYLLLQKKYYLVLPVLILSVLVKYISILLLPFFIWYILKKQLNLKQRAKWIGINFVSSLMVLAIFILPFGMTSLQSGFLAQAEHFTVHKLSILPWFIFNVLGVSPDATKIISVLIFAVIYLILIVYFFNKNKMLDLIKISAGVLASYLLLAGFYVWPWYLLWLFPLLILIDKKIFLYGFGFFVLMGFGYMQLASFALAIIFASVIITVIYVLRERLLLKFYEKTN